MIILDATTKSLQFKLSAAVTTNQLPFAASYVDSTSSTTTPGEQDGTSNSTTAVTIVAAPATSTQRLVKNILIQNADTAAATVTVIYNNNSTLRNVFVATLSVGDQLIYEDGNGWVCVDKNGNTKTSGGSSSTTLAVSGGGTGDTSFTPYAVITGGTTSTGALQNVSGVGTSGQVLTSNGGSALPTWQNAGSGSGTVVYSSIAGCLPTSVTGTATTAAVSISAGQAADSTNAAYITSAGYSWAVSNGNAINGYQGGTTLPASSTIHFFVCSGGSGTGSFASTSLTPTLPTGYSTYYRRIFSLVTGATTTGLLPGTALETEGGGLTFYLSTQPNDINVSNLGTTRVLYTLSVPTGIKVRPILRMSAGVFGQAYMVIVTSGDEPDGQMGNYNYDYDNSTSGIPFLWTQPYLTTNTSGQIGARSSNASTNVFETTRGWVDFRRS